jgi:Tfp pilus assembly protein PilV
VKSLISSRPSRANARRTATGRGFTVVEVAVTVFVLAVVISTSITTLQRAYSNLDTARNISTASSILQTELENERLFTWGRLNDPTYQPTLGAAHLSNPAIAGRFSISRAVVTVPNRSSQMIQVTVTVRWRSYDGRSLSRSFTTYFTQGGLNDFYYGA